ncbi:hypothetical protein T07_9699 [Trichinella nelsoni]|uniref:Peptidase S1 domain-containing protein n=1 Tax=Trichinella nelsoni TaxID=6336 RepID=A0A0V0RNS9_9BILA|nr:hypothetical protein T07_9699 [Trichinella nelsoni]
MEVQFDINDEHIHKALTTLYPNYPEYDLLQDIPTADSVGHVVAEQSENVSIVCTAVALFSPKRSETLLLLTAIKCLPRRRLPDMIAFFTGFQPTISGKAAAALIRIHTVSVREIGNGNLGFLILEMSKSIWKRENGTSYPRRARRREHINGVDSCHTTGLDERGIAQNNKVDIVTPIACEQFFGNKFDRNFMICVSEERSPITHSVGAPLICKKHNVEIAFGIKLALSTEYENENENNATASAYLRSLMRHLKPAFNVSYASFNNVQSSLSVKSTECGNVRQFNYTEEDYFYDRQPFPWTAHLKIKYAPSVECLGVLIQLAPIQKASNTSDLVLTSSKCLGYDESLQGVVENTFIYNFFVQESMRAMRVFFGQYNSTEMLRGSRIRRILTFSDGRSKIPLAVLQLSLPVTFNARRMPICLKEEIPIFSNQCFVSGFNSKKNSLSEYPLRLNEQLPCTTVQRLDLPDISAKQGAPLTCFINGIGHLYGIYVKRIPASTKRYILSAKCFDTEEEDLRKALSDLYPNHPPFTISTGYLPSTVAHVIGERNQHWSILCTGMFIFTHNSVRTSQLITSSQCFPRRTPSIKFAFTGFHSEEGELPKTMLLKIKLIEHMPFKGCALPVNQVGIASVQLYQSVEYRNKATAIRLPHFNEDLTGIEYCLLGGIDEQGYSKHVEVIIVNHEACKIVYGPRFHSEYMICGLEPKNKLTHTMGAPLICSKRNENVYMGIKIKLGVENEPYEDNDMDISAYIQISKFDLLYYEPLQ